MPCNYQVFYRPAGAKWQHHMGLETREEADYECADIRRDYKDNNRQKVDTKIIKRACRYQRQINEILDQMNA